MKIALFSSWLPEVSVDNYGLVKNIASYLVEKNIELVTGGCTGIPGICIEEVFRLGGKTSGYFPNKDKYDYEDLRKKQGSHDLKFYTSCHFVQGFTSRSLEMIKHVDAAIVLNGRIGTLSEFGIAVEEGLPIAVIESTGGISDELRKIVKVAQKEFPNNEVVFEKDYKKAIDSLVQYFNTNNKTI